MIPARGTCDSVGDAVGGVGGVDGVGGVGDSVGDGVGLRQKKLLQRPVVGNWHCATSGLCRVAGLGVGVRAG